MIFFRIFWNEKAKYFHYPWYLAVYKNLDLAKDLFIVVKLMLYLGGISVILANYTIFSSNVSRFNVEQFCTTFESAYFSLISFIF